MSKWVMTWDHPGSSGKWYRVSVGLGGEWGCSCADWKFRRKTILNGECKHIQEKKFELAWKDGDPATMMKLTAARVARLRDRGKDEDEIKETLTEDMAKLELRLAGEGA